MIRSAARSASVTGDPSSLPSIFIAPRLTARMAAPARTTRSVKGCISPAAVSLLITVPDKRASIMGGSHTLLVFPICILTCVGSTRVRSVSNQRACVIRRVRAVANFQEHLMSGTSSPGPVPDALELAALLCSRVCHDLISPAGAIVNGLEVLEESDDEETKTFALTLIKKSARTATARLQFCRIAFGAAGSITAQVDTGDAEQVARGFIEDEKVKL